MAQGRHLTQHIVQLVGRKYASTRQIEIPQDELMLWPADTRVQATQGLRQPWCQLCIDETTGLGVAIGTSFFHDGTTLVEGQRQTPPKVKV